jgi:hypothetical protein
VRLTESSEPTTRPTIAWTASDDRALAVLRRGRLLELEDELRGCAAADVPMGERLLAMELAMRTGRARLPDMDRLRIDVRATGRIDHQAWMASLLALHAFWRGEYACFQYAAVELESLEDETELSPLGLVGRGRLRRLVATGMYMGAHGFGIERADVLLAAALADLGAAGARDDLIVTRLIGAAYGSFAHLERMAGLRPSVRRLADELVQMGSDRRSYGKLVVAIMALCAHDFEEARVALDEADGMGPPVSPDEVVTVRMVSMLYNLMTVPSHRAAEAFAAAAAHFRTSTGLLGGNAARLASILADYGVTEGARHVSPPLESAGSQSLLVEFDIRTVHARLDILEGGGPEALAKVNALLDDLDANGLPGRCARVAQSAARDCARKGLKDAADELRARALASAPGHGRQVLEVLESPEPPVALPGGPPGELLVLGPDLVVRRRGEEIALGHVAAKLLVLLVVRRRPVTTEWMLEMLWPDGDPRVTRGRLKSLLSRLRKLLDVGRDEFIVREAAGLRLEPGEWRIDSWELLDLCTGTDTDRVRAFRAYSGDLCYRQFAYDEDIEAERAALRERWLELARDLVSAGLVDGRTALERTREIVPGEAVLDTFAA